MEESEEARKSRSEGVKDRGTGRVGEWKSERERGKFPYSCPVQFSFGQLSLRLCVMRKGEVMAPGFALSNRDML